MSLGTDGRSVAVLIDDPQAAKASEAVYAWVDRDRNVIRVGTSLKAVGRRLRQYQGHITQSLNGKPKPTPYEEALRWVEVLRRGDLIAMVHVPKAIDTAIGPVRPYLDMERHMIANLKPSLLNRSHR